MTLNGQAFELPTLEQHIKGSVSSSLPTPTVSDQYTGSLKSTQQKPGSLHSVTLAQVFFKEDLFPTPKARDSQQEGYEAGLRRDSPQVGTIVRGLVERDPRVLLPTTRVSMANGPTQKEIREGNPKSRIEVEVMLGETNWGRFEAAIRRWEEVIGRPAPKPTKSDGKDGGNRLSSLFTEWLMGLPEGWITGLGLKRNEELKLAGNGVVPQQAELALRLLLEDDNLLERIKK
jgi:DNA (cytosine-5)-methyltransferase 1